MIPRTSRPHFLVITTILLVQFSFISTQITPESSSLQNLLITHGLPGGLFPQNIKSYALDKEREVLEVFFERPCLAMFETSVRFDRVVRANLSYGGLLGVEGLTQKELFLWLPVKDIIVTDPTSGVITFNIGYAEKQLASAIFMDPPICTPQGLGYKRCLEGSRTGRALKL